LQRKKYFVVVNVVITVVVVVLVVVVVVVVVEVVVGVHCTATEPVVDSLSKNCSF